MNMSKPITIRLSPEVVNRLTSVSESLRKERKLIQPISRQKLLVEAVEDFIAKHSTK